jgi:hypothetical protein
VSSPDSSNSGSDTPGSPPAEASAGEAPLPDAVARLTATETDTADRAKALGEVVTAADASGRRGLRRFIMGPKAAVRWALDTLVELTPHLPIRDLETLRRHHGGRTGDELAEALIRNASRVSAGIGAAGGGLAAVEWVAPPTLLTAPVLIAAETVGVVAVEVKLIAELHEAYGVGVRGSASDKGARLLTAWAQRRGVSLSLLNPGLGMTTVLGAGLRKQLRDRLVRRMGRNLTTIGPLLTGAAVAAELNRRATKSLGESVRDDLRRSAPPRPELSTGR